MRAWGVKLTLAEALQSRLHRFLITGGCMKAVNALYIGAVRVPWAKYLEF